MSEGRELASAENPYAAPGSDIAGGGHEFQRSIAEGHGYVDPTRAATATSALLGLRVFAHAGTIVSCSVLLSHPGAALARQMVELSRTIVKLTQATNWLAIVAFAVFFVRVNKNARAFVYAKPPEQEWGYREPIGKFSPASMVWWFVVPVFNLIRPYQAVQTVWLTSTPEGSDEEAESQGKLLPIWWASYLAMNVATVVAILFKGFGPAPHNMLVIASCVISVGACFAAMPMVQALKQRQRRRAAQLGASSRTSPSASLLWQTRSRRVRSRLHADAARRAALG